jgi:hypothetical protein
MALPRFFSITGEGGATTNTRAAAALIAYDVPLDVSRTLTTISGDGITGTKVTWHLAEKNARGESSLEILKVWDDQEYAKANPDCPIVRMKAAFVRYAELVRDIQQGTIHLFAPSVPFIETHHTQTAAAMEQLGHPIIGVAYGTSGYKFRFSQSAAADFALWTLPPGELERRLPDALISYLWCAFDNHRVMVDFIKDKGPQFAAVQHRGRTAYVGADMSKDQINQLDRLLYRK